MPTFKITSDIEKNISLCSRMMRDRVHKYMTPNSNEARITKSMEFLSVDDIDKVETLVSKAERDLATAQKSLSDVEEFFNDRYTAFINK